MDNRFALLQEKTSVNRPQSGKNQGNKKTPSQSTRNMPTPKEREMQRKLSEQKKVVEATPTQPVKKTNVLPKGDESYKEREFVTVENKRKQKEEEGKKMNKEEFIKKKVDPNYKGSEEKQGGNRGGRGGRGGKGGRGGRGGRGGNRGARTGNERVGVDTRVTGPIGGVPVLSGGDGGRAPVRNINKKRFTNKFDSLEHPEEKRKGRSHGVFRTRVNKDALELGKDEDKVEDKIVGVSDAPVEAEPEQDESSEYFCEGELVDGKVDEPKKEDTVKRKGYNYYKETVESEKEKVAKLLEEKGIVTKKELSAPTIDVTSLNKKEQSILQPEEKNDELFIKKKQTEKPKKKKTKEVAPNELNLGFKTKRHRGFNTLPDENRKDFRIREKFIKEDRGAPKERAEPRTEKKKEETSEWDNVGDLQDSTISKQDAPPNWDEKKTQSPNYNERSSPKYNNKPRGKGQYNKQRNDNWKGSPQQGRGKPRQNKYNRYSNQEVDLQNTQVFPPLGN